MADKDEIQKIKAAADELVRSYQNEETYKPRLTGPKILHDSVWGTIRLSAGEAALIDLPIYQRLRFIHQTSFVFHVYPGARHSRLEHSIGVMHMVTRMAGLLEESHPDQNLISKSDLKHLRVAALLHDIGHGPFSHISEYAYESHSWFAVLKKDPLYAGKPSEALSGLVILSKPFRTIFTKIQQKCPELADVDLELVVKLIYGKYDEIGKVTIQGQSVIGHKSYIGSLINGPFDADKLDYISRDRHNTGLDLLVDIERLLSSMVVLAMDEGRDHPVFRLVLSRAGMTALEHIVQSKLQLAAAVYNHPKVRATDAMFQRFMRYMHSKSGQLGDSPFRLATPLDFLKYNDVDFLNENLHQDAYLKRVVRMLKTRELPVRVIEISNFTMDKGLAEIAMNVLAGKPKDKSATEEALAKLIYEKLTSEGLAKGYAVEDIIVDLPYLPSLNEASKTWLMLPGGEKVQANARFKTDDWLAAYNMNKWRGHVFCPPAVLTHRTIEICKEVLAEQLEIAWKGNLPETCSKALKFLSE